MGTRPRVAILSARGSYAVDTLVATGAHEYVSVDASAFGRSHPCPYGLPSVSEGDLALVVSGYLERARAEDGASVEEILGNLRRRFGRVVALDQHDAFRLSLPDREIDHVDAVLKVNGAYRNPDLHRYPVGATSPDGAGAPAGRPPDRHYSDANLKKIRVSLPCFAANVPQVRRRVRALYGVSLAARLARAAAEWLLPPARPIAVASPPPFTVHFLGALTHPLRARAVRQLRASGLRWKGGITRIGDAPPTLSPAELTTLRQELSRDGLLVERQNRLRYLHELRSCKAVLSVYGIGEVCFRMAEAWASRRLLVCQDLSEARLLFPLEAGRNVVFCRPDLSDLVPILRDVEQNLPDYVEIAERGHQDWREWSARIVDHLRDAFAALDER